MGKIVHKIGQKFGDWNLLKHLDDGGNGEIWLAENSKNEKAAIKLLKKIKPKAYSRFCDECKTVLKHSDIQGILPILDYYLPEKISSSIPWYVMPVAVPLSKYLKDKEAQEIVESIIPIAETLHALHLREISHRDIKPANLFFFDSTFFIGDFGLVDYPEKGNLTQKGEEVGPKWTMAPEMKRNAEKADGIPADVYSLAKTLWILLTKENKGFEGQYMDDAFIGLKRYQASIFTRTLDKLLYDCTENDPSKRPNLEQFANRLKEWISINKDYSERNKLEWLNVQEKLFPTAIPSRVIWGNINDILSVLKIVSSIDNLNHMFLPNGGGLDLKNVKLAYEGSCLELDFGGAAHVVKPKRLIFESFGDEAEWNYFRLETGDLDSVGTNSSYRNEEALTEIEPGLYADYECLEYDDFNGEKLPPSARQIIRVLKGDFVIFQKTSTYNKNHTTYDGRHNKLTADEFRSYIFEAIKYLNKKKNICIEQSIKANKPKFIKPKTFRKNERILTQKECKLLNQIIVLSKNRIKEDEELKRKFGISDYHKFPPDDYYNAPRPQAEKLKSFLKNLSQKDIELVAAVMYGGRDYLFRGRTMPFQEMIQYFSYDTGLLESIFEKEGSLVNYLQAGIKAYSEELGHVT